MSLEITGHLKAVSEYKQITEKFGVQKFYLDIDKNSQYPSVAEFQIVNKKIDINTIPVNTEITVSFNISGRKWEKDGRSGFAQSLNAWKVTTSTIQASAPEQVPNGEQDDILPY